MFVVFFPKYSVEQYRRQIFRIKLMSNKRDPRRGYNPNIINVNVTFQKKKMKETAKNMLFIN